MPQLKNFVAVDWRAGRDAIHFFFKDTETFSRFNIADNKVPDGYPRAVNGRWDTFSHAKDLLFGFTTTGLDDTSLFKDTDISWLFYVNEQTPMVCKYDQGNDKVIGNYAIENTFWQPILPYFEKIVAGTSWQHSLSKFVFRFLLNDGHFLDFNLTHPNLQRREITYNTTRGLELYTDRFITAVQNDRAFDTSLWYIFLTGNQYLVYDIDKKYLTAHARNIDEGTWPGLLRD